MSKIKEYAAWGSRPASITQHIMEKPNPARKFSLEDQQLIRLQAVILNGSCSELRYNQGGIYGIVFSSKRIELGLFGGAGGYQDQQTTDSCQGSARGPHQGQHIGRPERSKNWRTSKPIGF